MDLKGQGRERYDFLALLNTFRADFVIDEYTRVTRTSKSCIDNIFTNISMLDSEVILSHLSDHSAQFCSFNVSIRNQGSEGYRYRCLSEQNIQRFRDHLGLTDWSRLYAIPSMM